MKHSYLSKISEYGIVRSIAIVIGFYLLPKLRGTLLKFFYTFDTFGQNVRILSGVDVNNPHTSLGDNVVLSKNVKLGGVGKITIGKNTGLGANTYVESINSISIGANCQIAQMCYFIDHDHYFKNSKVSLIQQTNFENDLSTSRPIIIGDNCWIGANALILKGVTLGDGCIVAAGSVVTKSFPAGSIIAGVPARKVSQRT